MTITANDDDDLDMPYLDETMTTEEIGRLNMTAAQIMTAFECGQLPQLTEDELKALLTEAHMRSLQATNVHRD